MRRSAASKPALERHAALTYPLAVRATRESIEGVEFMYMFLPFLLAVAVCACVWRSRAGLGYALWGVTVLVTVAWFLHHATDPLQFSF